MAKPYERAEQKKVKKFYPFSAEPLPTGPAASTLTSVIKGSLPAQWGWQYILAAKYDRARLKSFTAQGGFLYISEPLIKYIHAHRAGPGPAPAFRPLP